MLQIKKDILDKARENGVIERLNILLSVAYLLISDASLFIAEAEILTERNKLKLGEIKHGFSKINTVFDRLTSSFARMIDSCNVRDWMKDLDELDKIMHTWQSIPDKWEEGEPQYVDEQHELVFKCKKHEN